VFLPEAERPREQRRLGMLLSGESHPLQWAARPRPLDLYDALGMLEVLFERLGGPAPQLARGLPPPELLHPGRGARLVQGGREIGFAGVLHPELRSRLELRDEAVVVEIAIEELLEKVPRIVRFQALDRFPVVERDLSILCDEDVSAAEVLARVRRGAGARLRSVRLVDRYAGNQVPSGKVSLTLGLRFQNDERTLTSEEVQADVDGIVRELRAAGLEIRGE